MSAASLYLLFALPVLLSGYPVGLALGGYAIGFALIAGFFSAFDFSLLGALPLRMYGIMVSPVLIAIPLFILMSMLLSASGLVEDLFRAASRSFNQSRRGLSLAVLICGAILAAATGVVGASVVTLGLLALPSLLKSGEEGGRAASLVAASGTLGQLIPPSIVLIVLADQLSSAQQQVLAAKGEFAADVLTIADLFAGALFPGLLLVGLFALWLLFRPANGANSDATERGGEAIAEGEGNLLTLLLPIALILSVLGSILLGIATPAESAGIGAFLALMVCLWRTRDQPIGVMGERLFKAFSESVHLISAVFLIVIGASVFALVFRGLGGDRLVEAILGDLPGGAVGALLVTMLVIFLLGFVLEFLEISMIVVPLTAPVLLAMPLADGSLISPIWLGVLIAINLQTSFLTPPFGVALFYLKGVVPSSVATLSIYRGIVPFVMLQLACLAIVFFVPGLATWLPSAIFTP